MRWNGRFASSVCRWQPAATAATMSIWIKISKVCAICHKELRQCCRRKGVQPDTGTTYIMRGWWVYVDGVCIPLCVMCEHSIYSSEKKAGDEWRVMREVRDWICTLSSSHLLVMSSLLDQSLSSSEFQLTCLQNYQNFHPALIVSTPPLVKEAFTGCSLKSSQLNRTEQDTKDSPPFPLPSQCVFSPVYNFKCFSKGFCYGGNTFANKSCLPKLYLKGGCREKEHVGEMETRGERKKKPWEPFCRY